MKLHVEFIGVVYYNQHVEVNDTFITKLCGQSAMNMLFEQDEYLQHKVITLWLSHTEMTYRILLKHRDHT